jgi:hypothetical protein
MEGMGVCYGQGGGLCLVVDVGDGRRKFVHWARSGDRVGRWVTCLLVWISADLRDGYMVFEDCFAQCSLELSCLLEDHLFCRASKAPAHSQSYAYDRKLLYYNVVENDDGKRSIRGLSVENNSHQRLVHFMPVGRYPLPTP